MVVCRCGVDGRSTGLICERHNQPAHGVERPHGVWTGGCYACDDIAPSVAKALARITYALSDATDLQLREECVRRGWRSALVDMTDDQLRAEWSRRHPDHARIIARELPDADLRAECIRRFPSGFGQVHETTLRERDMLKAHANESAKLAEALRDERDEWKRRAEAAEAIVNGQINAARAICDATLMTERGHDPTHGCSQCAECGSLHVGPNGGLDALAAHVKAVHFGTKWRRDGEDMSKGIAAQRPDNSIAHLPEDLLCDDA